MHQLNAFPGVMLPSMNGHFAGPSGDLGYIQLNNSVKTPSMKSILHFASIDLAFGVQLGTCHIW